MMDKINKEKDDAAKEIQYKDFSDFLERAVNGALLPQEIEQFINKYAQLYHQRLCEDASKEGLYTDAEIIDLGIDAHQVNEQASTFLASKQREIDKLRHEEEIERDMANAALTKITDLKSQLSKRDEEIKKIFLEIMEYQMNHFEIARATAQYKLAEKGLHLIELKNPSETKTK